MKAKDRASFEAVTSLYSEQSDRFDFWTEPRSYDQSMDIMVPPAFANQFISLLRKFDVDYRVKIADVQRYFSRNTRPNVFLKHLNYLA